MTNTNLIIQQSIRQLIVECHDDQVGLWSVLTALKHNGIEAFPPEMRRIAMQVIRALLNGKDIIAFNYYKPRYYLWNVSPEEALKRIEKEWDELGYNPGLGDRHIVWFTSKALAQKLVDAAS